MLYLSRSCVKRKFARTKCPFYLLWAFLNLDLLINRVQTRFESVGGLFLIGLGCLLRWWALVFLSKGAGAGPIATQLGPVCAQTYATPARSKFFGKQNRSRQAMTG